MKERETGCIYPQKYRILNAKKKKRNRNQTFELQRNIKIQNSKSNKQFKLQKNIKKQNQKLLN